MLHRSSHRAKRSANRAGKGRQHLLSRIVPNDFADKVGTYPMRIAFTVSSESLPIPTGTAAREARDSGEMREEFNMLANQWRNDTRHLSLISKKVMHQAYFRIMGMGPAVVPLLLEELRDRPAHWFTALKATTNVDPAPQGSSSSEARQAWLDWGRGRGLLN